MDNKQTRTGFSAARATAAVFGVLAGIGGLTHGVGEVLQGNRAPDSVVFESWTVGPIASNMGGEPAMTVVPNLLATGVLTMLVSLAVIAWSIWFVQRRQGGLVLILLSLGMLLVGGGFGPPIIGLLSGVAGIGINAQYRWWRRHLPGGLRRTLAELWPWVFGFNVLNGVFLVIGSLILVFLFGVNNPDLFTNSFLLSVLGLPVTIVCGIGHDIERSDIGG